MNSFNYPMYTMVCANGDKLKDSLYYSYDESGYVKLMSRCIPRSPGKSTLISYPPILDEHLVEHYFKLPPNSNYTDEVLILTPIRDAAHLMEKFGAILQKLTYPHHLIRVGFGEDGSVDNTLEVATNVAKDLKTKYDFKDAMVFQLPIKGKRFSRSRRHDDDIQIERRSHLAKVRNMLTERALKREQWILWIDIDVVEIRNDVIEQFIYSNKDVMVASVFFKKVPFRIFQKAVVYELFERNSFNETVQNGHAYRLYPHDFKSYGREVPIQFVGSCLLMVRADCIRKGLNFPESVITSPESLVKAIESEGLGMLARKMGFGVYTLPFLEAFHH
jgi:mannan polymerase complexes MNN9 subunit/mannan polymerase II complex ANP1 subunit